MSLKDKFLAEAGDRQDAVGQTQELTGRGAMRDVEMTSGSNEVNPFAPRDDTTPAVNSYHGLHLFGNPPNDGKLFYDLPETVAPRLRGCEQKAEEVQPTVDIVMGGGIPVFAPAPPLVHEPWTIPEVEMVDVFEKPVPILEIISESFCVSMYVDILLMSRVVEGCKEDGSPADSAPRTPPPSPSVLREKELSTVLHARQRTLSYFF